MKISYINKFLKVPLEYDDNTEAVVQRVGNGTFNIVCGADIFNVKELTQPMPIHSNKLTLESITYYFDLAKCLGMRQTANLMFPLLLKKALKSKEAKFYYEFYDINTYLDLAVAEINGVRCCIPIPLLSRESALRFLKQQPQIQKKLVHNRVTKDNKDLQIIVNNFFLKHYTEFSNEFEILENAGSMILNRLA